MSCVACGHDPDAIVSARWTFHLDADSGSMNDRKVNAGASRWAYRAARDAWSWRIRIATQRIGITAATTFRRVELVRCYGGRQRELDGDNWIGGTKSLIDALVKSGLLVDDNSKFAAITYKQRRCETMRGIAVTIEELAA